MSIFIFVGGVVLEEELEVSLMVAEVFWNDVIIGGRKD